MLSSAQGSGGWAALGPADAGEQLWGANYWSLNV